MNYKLNDFEKFAISNGMNTNTINSYVKSLNCKNLNDNIITLSNSIISPSIIEERKLNVATMDVFSRLMVERIIFLGTAIDADVANIVTSQLMYLNSVDSLSDIKLFINTPGGSCQDGLTIYDIMEWVNCDVATYCMGMAASMGSIILSSGKKGKRYCLPHSKVMIHQVSTGIGRITTADLKIEYDEMEKTQNILYGILAENSGKSFEQIQKDADRDKWFTAQEALNYGLIDEIIKNNKN